MSICFAALHRNDNINSRSSTAASGNLVDRLLCAFMSSPLGLIRKWWICDRTVQMWICLPIIFSSSLNVLHFASRISKIPFLHATYLFSGRVTHKLLKLKIQPTIVFTSSTLASAISFACAAVSDIGMGSFAYISLIAQWMTRSVPYFSLLILSGPLTLTVRALVSSMYTSAIFLASTGTSLISSLSLTTGTYSSKYLGGGTNLTSEEWSRLGSKLYPAWLLFPSCTPTLIWSPTRRVPPLMSVSEQWQLDPCWVVGYMFGLMLKHVVTLIVERLVVNFRCHIFLPQDILLATTAHFMSLLNHAPNLYGRRLSLLSLLFTEVSDPNLKLWS